MDVPFRVSPGAGFDVAAVGFMSESPHSDGHRLAFFAGHQDPHRADPLAASPVVALYPLV